MTENISAIPEPDVSEENPVSEYWIWAGEHRPAVPRALVEHMTGNWATVTPMDEVHPAATYCATRRARIAEEFSGRTLVVATGNYKVRANDTDYRFRAGTDFFYLTGCEEPDAVLVIAPSSDGPRSTLYVAHRRDQRTHEFFTDARYGELWVGARRGVTEAARYYEINTAPLDSLESALAALATTEIVSVRGFDRNLDDYLEPNKDDHALAAALSEHRLVK